MTPPVRAVRIVAAVTAAAACAAAPAAAGDQSLRLTLTERLFADTNVQLQQGDGFSVGSLTSLGISYANRRPTSALTLSAGFSYNLFSNGDNDNIDGLFPNLSGGYVVNRPGRSLRVSFGGAVQPVEFFTRTGFLLTPEDPFGEDPDAPIEPEDPDAPTEPEDPDAPAPPEPELPVDENGDGIPDDQQVDEEEPEDPAIITAADSDEAIRVTYSFGAGYSQQVNTRERFSLNAQVGRTDFIGDAGTFVPSTNVGAGGSYSRRLTDRISTGIGASAAYFQSEDSENRRSVSLSVGPSLNWRRTPAEVYSFSLGPAYTFTTFDRRTAAGVESVTEDSFSLRGAAGLTFITPITRFSASLTQGATPADEGVLVNQTTLNLGVTRRLSATSSANAGLATTYRTALNGDASSGFEDDIFTIGRLGYSRSINSRSSGNVTTFAQLDDEGGTDEFITGVSVGYSHRLTQRIAANLGYTFRLERTGQEDLTSHRVGLTLSRAFTVIP